MAKEFEDNLLNYLKSNGLIEGIKRTLLAVSGGADSVAMAQILYRLKQRGKLDCDFVIGHINHCLRGVESDADEVFVQQLGKSLRIDVVSQRVDVKKYATVHKLSIETAGRQLRLKTLIQMAERNDCGCIATAHHKDDLAETMVHRFMRGTGFRGLCGIWPVSEVYGARFIRPMLGVRRAEIIEFCKNNSIEWCEDVSNQDTNFTRNKIRHQLLPVLEGESSVIVDKLEKLSFQCKRFQLFTEKSADDVVNKGNFDVEKGQFSIDKKFLLEIMPWIFYEAIRDVLVRMEVGLRRYTREHFDGIRELVNRDQGCLMLPGDIAAEVSNGKLVFLKNIQTEECLGDLSYEGGSLQLEIGKSISFGPWQIESRLFEHSMVSYEKFINTKDQDIEWFDAERITGSIEIRCRQNGDRFWPIGALNEKKVGRFLIDAQLDKKAKQEAVIIKDEEKILWVVPIRMCEQAKVTAQTSQVLEIRVLRRELHGV